MRLVFLTELLTALGKLISDSEFEKRCSEVRHRSVHADIATKPAAVGVVSGRQRFKSAIEISEGVYGKRCLRCFYLGYVQREIHKVFEALLWR